MKTSIKPNAQQAADIVFDRGEDCLIVPRDLAKGAGYFNLAGVRRKEGYFMIQYFALCNDRKVRP
jgi:hypothetical protein